MLYIHAHVRNMYVAVEKGAPSTRHVFVLTSLGGLFMSLVTMATSGHTHPRLQLWATASACVFYGVSIPSSVSALHLVPQQFAGTLFATLEMVKSISGKGYR